MSLEEKAWLNEYHESVYTKISPYLNQEEKDWLKEYTRKIS
jgi:Xaa-Pro aminopeptidase